MKKIVGIFLLGITVLWTIFNIYSNYKFRRNFKFSIGQVTRITNVLRQSSNVSIEYTYIVNGRRVNSANIIHLCPDLTLKEVETLLLNKKFSIAYYYENPRISTIILTREAASNFNYKIPDSLSVYDSILSCK